MDHKEIQGKLLIYIDGGLSGTEMDMFREHINSCPVCNKQFEAFYKLWKLEEKEKRDVPQYIWTKLEAEIKEYGQNPVSFDIFNVRNKFVYILKPALIAVVVFISILTGYFGGDILSKEINGNYAVSNKEQVADAFYLDRLETEQINNALNIASNGNGEGVSP